MQCDKYNTMNELQIKESDKCNAINAIQLM